MKTKIPVCLVAVAWTVAAYSQRISPNSMFSCYTLELASRPQPAITLPYASVTIVDERPDTLKAGYYYPHLNDRNAQKICFKKSMTNEVSSFLNSYIKYNNDSSNNRILACVKKIWFGNYDTTNVKEDKITIRTRKLSMKIEFYLNDQSCYYPLYRFDSTYNLGDMPGKLPSFVLESALAASLRKLTSNNYKNYKNLQCLSMRQIDSFNTVATTYPVLRETVAAKGVYMTIDQFRNNQPAYTEFKLSLGRENDLVSISRKGTEDTTVKAWAVSDGKKMYVRSNNNYFALFKSGATYDFYGFDTYFDPLSGNSNAPMGIYLLTILTSKRTKSKPFQVNLETGEVY